MGRHIMHVQLDLCGSIPIFFRFLYIYIHLSKYTGVMSALQSRWFWLRVEGRKDRRAARSTGWPGACLSRPRDVLGVLLSKAS